VTVGSWIEVEQTYTRRGWGLRHGVENHIREITSVSPSQVGAVLGSVGVTDWAKKVDTLRGLPRGTTVKDLDRIATRRRIPNGIFKRPRTVEGSHC
jgi:hypothetical protein